MKKMVELKCKNCSASLSVAPNQQFITCDYCGSMLERELDYEELRRVNSQEAAKKVLKYKENLTEWNGLQKKHGELEESIKKNSIMGITNVFTENPMILSGIIAVLGVMFCIASLLEKNAPVLGLMTLFIAVLCYIGLKFYHQQTIAENEKKRKNCEIEKKYLEEIEQKIQEMKRSFNIDYIPENHRTEESLNIIYALLASETADSIHAAINQCETEMQRRELLKMQEQQKKEMEELKAMKQELAQSRQQVSSQKKDGSTIAAAGAMLVGTAVAKKVVKNIFDNLDL